MSGNSIADSSAVLIPGKVLAQHHTAITLLAEMLAARAANQSVGWLDLACGRGQIIAHLEDTIPDGELRAKVRYLGYDIDSDYTRETERKAASLKLGAANVVVGQLDHFPDVIKSEQRFSFVTFTNVVHELPPVLFGSLLLELILRMEMDAKLYIYDMETLPEPELGAVPWDASDVRRLLAFVFKESGSKLAPPMVQRWPHSSCTAWSVTFGREKLEVDAPAFTKNLPELKAKTTEFIAQLFKEKLQRTIAALEEITKYGGQTGEEQKRKMNLLFDYWSLSRL
jgi:SAM-dependent methyltransferase